MRQNSSKATNIVIIAYYTQCGCGMAWAMSEQNAPQYLKTGFTFVYWPSNSMSRTTYRSSCRKKFIPLTNFNDTFQSDLHM